MATDAIETGIAYWQLAQALHILAIVRDPFRPMRHARKLAWGGYLLTIAEPLIITSALSGPFSSADVDDHHKEIKPTCLPPRLARLLDGIREALSIIDVAVVVAAAAVSLM